VNIINETGSVDPANPMQGNYTLEEINENIDRVSSTIAGIPLVFYGTKASATNNHQINHSEIFGATAIAETLLDAQIIAYKLADTLALPAKTFQKDIGDQGML
jgi:phosphoribosylamine-glycine ligase